VSALAWPDIVIAVVVLFGALKGLKGGLVRELTGAVALAFGILAAFHYPGMWDGFISKYLHVAKGTTHIVGMVAYAIVAYAIVLALGTVLSTVAKLPLLNIVNALGGALVGALKAAVFLWIVLYVALFFPLTSGLREDLHHSSLVAELERPDAWIDTMLRATLPSFVAPYADALFSKHRV
jgi:uncharacterized membrane protein required for colicin V production